MYVVTGYVLLLGQLTFYTDTAPKSDEAQSALLVPGTHDDDGLPLPEYRERANLDDVAA